MADYNLIANFNVNVRVERFLLMDTGFGEPLRVPDIPYSQARLTMSDMEDILKNDILTEDVKEDEINSITLKLKEIEKLIVSIIE